MTSEHFIVSLAHDGTEPSPRQTAESLFRLTSGTTVAADYYGNGGAVRDFEDRIADVLGKERAVLFPTGTLANLIGITCLCGGGGGRILVHQQSHLFNDSGDNLSALGGLTMVPLEGQGAGFDARAIDREVARAATARVRTRVACVTVESPNRRLHGARFTDTDRNSVVAAARRHDVPLFLDGARLFIEAAYTGQEPAELTAPFDLVYVSLYKYLGAPFGCLLAGPRDLLEDIYHARRQFGGGLYQMWPAAVLASDHLDGHLARWSETINESEAVIDRLARSPDLKIERIAEGTNVFLVHCDRLPKAELLKSLGRQHGIALPMPQGGVLAIKVNETWLRWSVDTLADRILASLGEAMRVAE